MTDPDARYARVVAIVEANHGRLIAREGDTVEIEVPADVAIGLAAIWGRAGINPVFIGCDMRQSERRVLDHDARTVVCHGDMVTTSFNRYRVYLTGKPPEAPAFLTPENIRKQ